MIALLCMACGPQSTPPGITTSGSVPQPSVASIPASSSCAEFDPAGVWTLRSDAHSPQDFTLHRDNTVALREGTLRWDWEEMMNIMLQGCIVRFEISSEGESCEYAVVETNAAVMGMASCCETGEPGVEIERAICNEHEISGVARLVHEGKPAQ